MAVDNQYSQVTVAKAASIVSTGAHFNTTEKAIRTRISELRTEITVLTHRMDFELRQREHLMKEVRRYEGIIENRVGLGQGPEEAESSSMALDSSK